MAKRLGANARRQMSGQKKTKVSKRKDHLKKMHQHLKMISVIFIFVSVCGVLGFAISKYKGILSFKVFKSENVEWSEIEIPKFVDVSSSQANQIKEGLFWLHSNDEWYLVNGKNEQMLVSSPMYKLPIVELKKSGEIEDVVSILSELRLNENELFNQVAQLQVFGDSWLVVWESSVAVLKVHPKNEPVKALRLFASFQKKYFEELKSTSEIDLRFPGYVFASKKES